MRGAMKSVLAASAANDQSMVVLGWRGRHWIALSEHRQLTPKKDFCSVARSYGLLTDFDELVIGSLRNGMDNLLRRRWRLSFFTRRESPVADGAKVLTGSSGRQPLARGAGGGSRACQSWVNSSLACCTCRNWPSSPITTASTRSIGLNYQSRQRCPRRPSTSPWRRMS